MSRDQAERWVVIAAAIVAGVYAYRRVTEPASTGKTSLKNVVGQGQPAPLGTFVTAWGFTFTVVSILATANPGLGGSFALLIATADFLANAPAIFSDIGKHSSTSPLGAAGGGSFSSSSSLTDTGGGSFSQPGVPAFPPPPLKPTGPLTPPLSRTFP